MTFVFPYAIFKVRKILISSAKRASVFVLLLFVLLFSLLQLSYCYTITKRKDEGGAYEFHIAIELTEKDIPLNIEAKKNSYGLEKNSTVT